jgi:hypothetical protein
MSTVTTRRKYLTEHASHVVWLYVSIVMPNAIDPRLGNFFPWFEFVANIYNFGHFLHLLRLATSRFVGQSPSFESLKRDLGALGIVNAEFRASVLPKIKFGEISVKVLFVHMLIDADQAALKDREETFQRVRMDVAACPLEFE